MISRNNGELVYVFGPDGVLLVGSPTTASGAGNYIDAATHAGDTSLDINLPYPTDLDGNTVTRLEMAGLGTLTLVTKTSASLASLALGYRIFFEAPVLAYNAGVPATAGIYYKVLSGAVTYNGTTYTQNQEFVTTGGVTTTSGTAGTFALCIPPALKNECSPFRTEQFKIKVLKDGTESNSYWLYDASGFNPMDSLVTTDPDFYGFTV